MRFIIPILISLLTSMPSFARQCQSPSDLVDDQNFVHSAGVGAVIYSGYDLESKKTVRIQSPDGWITSYGNLGQVFVEVGQLVDFRQIIAHQESDSLLIGLSLRNQVVCNLR